MKDKKKCDLLYIIESEISEAYRTLTPTNNDRREKQSRVTICMTNGRQQLKSAVIKLFEITRPIAKRISSDIALI